MRHSVPPRPTPVDTTPILGLVAILIPMLLMAYAPQVLAVIDSEVPSLCAARCGEGGPAQVMPKLTLTARGVTLEQVVAHPGAALGTSELPCAGACRTADDYDWAAVQDILAATRAETDGSGEVFILPTDDVPYETVVEAMDACRERTTPDGSTEALYPYPVLGAWL